jgi:hypothetical protein
MTTKCFFEECTSVDTMDSGLRLKHQGEHMFICDKCLQGVGGLRLYLERENSTEPLNLVNVTSMNPIK